MSVRAPAPLDRANRLRELPSIDRLLADPAAAALLEVRSRSHLTRELRAVLEEFREEIREKGAASAVVQPSVIFERVAARLHEASRRRMVRVINATGTILHTNLGRALLASSAVSAVQQAAASPVTLEYELASGTRGHREEAIEASIGRLTGAAAATVVNNNAAALLLALHALAHGREVVVSRGELIEIGGSFRLPDIMDASGAVLREVGTTNRTHSRDYVEAINERTALLLKVHTSNFKVIGFSAGVPLAELVRIGRERQIPILEDLGSGALVDLARYGLPTEPLVADSIGAGADVVTFSGDKLLGGPQAGLVAGRASFVRRMREHPMHRALRCGKLTLAALEETLRLYEQSPNLERDVPILRTLARPLTELDAIGERVIPPIALALGERFRVSMISTSCEVGSGALPTASVPSRAVAIEHDTLDPGKIARRFRAASPPIIGRIEGGRFLLDLRTVDDPLQLVPCWPPAEA